MGKFDKIIIVVPTFNEAENIPQLTEAIFSLPMEGIQLLFVDDNSPDGTGNVADAQSRKYLGRVHVIHRKAKKGLGSAYIEARAEDKKLIFSGDLGNSPTPLLNNLEPIALRCETLGIPFLGLHYIASEFHPYVGNPRIMAFQVLHFKRTWRDGAAEWLDDEAAADKLLEAERRVFEQTGCES